MTTMLEVQTTEELRRQIAVAEDEVVMAGERITEARRAYQEALDEEATGGAAVGTSRAAKEALADADHAQDLARARVRVLSRELEAAAVREQEQRAGQLASQIQDLEAQTVDLSQRLHDTVADLMEQLAEADALRLKGGQANVELTTLGPAGQQVRQYQERRVRFGGDVRRRLAAACEGRGYEGVATLLRT